MMRRLFWLGAGIAVGVLVVRKANQAVQSYSPSGLAGTARESAVGVLDTVRDFVADVREGMIQREEEIREAFAEGVMMDGEGWSDGGWNDAGPTLYGGQEPVGEDTKRG